ncbi:MAG: SPASM domain-containing protein [Planctomycetes bacterium]|nr:SPASM domain-containing protein [Planctomycetota bacterium]
MKLSKYTVFYGNNGDSLVYNTRTQGVLRIHPHTNGIGVGVNKEVRDFIGKIISNGVSLSPEEQQCLNTLKDSGIIVDKETDEDKVLESWFDEIKFRPRPLHATILTTFKCNFACTYCFEEGVKEQQTMDDQTADQVIAYLKHKAEEKQSPKIRLMFYGGEPLMNPAAIIKIASALQQWTAEKGIKFSFGMITNGSLVRKDIIERLTPLGLTSIRITLDGDKEVHDRRRPYLDGRGSFETIMANIMSITGMEVHPHTNSIGVGVKVELGANFDRANIAGLHRLLDYLEQKGLNKRIARVLFAPVVSRLGPSPILSPEGRGKGEGGADRVRGITVEPVGCHKLSGELAEEGIKLEKELIQRGYRTPSSVKVNACPMTMDDSMLVIDPAGDIYKCEAFVGREQFCIGNVRERRFNHRYAEFLALKPWKECGDCAYVPMCGGGCRYIAQLKHSDYTKPACDKEYYEKIFPQLLKMDYERGAL